MGKPAHICKKLGKAERKDEEEAGADAMAEREVKEDRVLTILICWWEAR